jgi:serine/threonine-protein kinase RsbW
VSKRIFHREFPSSIDAMSGVMAEALDALRENGWVASDNTFYAHLCLEEALVNAIVHGNHSDDSLTVRLDIAEEAGELVIRVWDEGKGFKVRDIAMPSAESHGGRGVCLMQHCMDHVTYDEGESCLVMRKRRAGGGEKRERHE